MKEKIILISLILISCNAISQKKVEILPKRSVAKVLLTGQNDYTYYALSEKVGTEYSVTGPGILTLNFRARIAPELFKSEPFNVKYIRDEKHVAALEIPELLISNLKLKSADLTGNPTRLHSVDIEVPPGKNKYVFYKNNSDQKIYIRVFYEEHPRPKWVDLQPTSILEKKELRYINTGTTLSYYRLTKQSDFNFSVTDTTRIRILVRPEFSYSMLEEIIFKIKLENLTTGHARVYKINSSKSNNTEFVSDDKVTPGTSSTFYLNLDKPLHANDKYSMSIVSGASAAVIRISQDKNLIK